MKDAISSPRPRVGLKGYGPDQTDAPVCAPSPPRARPSVGWFHDNNQTAKSDSSGDKENCGREHRDREEGFRPDFTHQLFDEERIEGFQEGQLKIRVLYTAASLDFLVKIETSGGGDNTRHVVRLWYAT